MTFPTVVTRATGTEAGDVFSFTVPIPGAAQAGDLMIIVEGCRFSGSTTWPSGWTQVLAPVGSDEAAARYKPLTAGDISTGSVTVSKGFHGQAAWVVYIISGFGAVEGSGCVDFGNNPPDPPSLTPSWGAKDTLWICMSTDRGSNNDLTSYPTNYGNGQVTGVSGADIWVATAERQLNASSEDPPVFGWSFHGRQQAGTIAVQPAPPSGGSFSPGIIG